MGMRKLTGLIISRKYFCPRMRYIRFILITALCLFCVGCSTTSYFLRINILNHQTEWFASGPFPYTFTLPNGDWQFQTKGRGLIVFSSKSVRARQINFTINYIEKMPYYEKGDQNSALLRKHVKWDVDYFEETNGKINYSIIGENIRGPAPENLLIKAAIGETEVYFLYMIRGNNILALTVQDFKNSTHLRKTILDIYKSMRFISDEEFVAENKKCVTCKEIN